MADKEISDLTLVGTMNATDWLHVKQGAADVRVVPSTLFALHLATSNPHNITKTTVALGNVSNDAQLKIASNLSDLASAATARTNLGVYSTTETNTQVSAHGNLTNNPHAVTKAQVDLANVQNYTISNDPDVNSTTQYASIAAVNAVRVQANILETKIIPVGMIAMWNGLLLASIPAGWAVCNGSNGTPDLRGSFIRAGAPTDSDGTVKVRDTGGAATYSHTHTGSSEAVALTKEQMPAHSHGYTGQFVGSGDTEGSSGRWSDSGFTLEANSILDEVGGGQTHFHGVTVNSSTVSSLPPFYALVFIMKI